MTSAMLDANLSTYLTTSFIFDPAQYKERASLLLLNGVVYLGFSSHCDLGKYTGWIMAYNASTLAQTTVLNVTPNGSQGSIWMSGGGLAADGAGNIFLLDANGTFDTTLDANGFPAQHDFGNAFLKISTADRLAVADYFASFDTVDQSDVDNDLGSGGTVLLPDLTDGSERVQHLALGAGKDSTIYVVNRDAMGKFNPNSNNIYQELPSVLSGQVFSTPAMAVLHAYDATNLSTELYNSNQASSNRDQFGTETSPPPPTIADGRVYVGTTNGVAVFGLLSPSH